MSAPKTIFKKCWWKPEGEGSSQDVKPTLPFPDSETLGTVLTLSGARENEEAIFEKPVFVGSTGEQQRWVDMDAINQRDREIITITANELTPYFFELVEATAGPYAGTGNTRLIVPGKAVTHRGWLSMAAYDDANLGIHGCVRWGKLDIESWEYPQTGYVQATFTLRVLYSPVASGAFLYF